MWILHIFIILFILKEWTIILKNINAKKEFKDEVESIGNESVAAIIPMRNEEKNAEDCIFSLEKSLYPLNEIIIINDNSTDKTSEIIDNLNKKNSKIKLINLKELPNEWIGKNYALYEGAKYANSEWLLFIDADVRLNNSTILKSLAYMKKNNIDLLSYSPYQVCKKTYEKIIQPEIFNLINYLFPLSKINKPNQSAAINGSFILIKKNNYYAIGGHKVIKGEILEDVAIAKKAIEKNLKIEMLPGENLVESKMYNSFKELFLGWSKNLYLLIKESKKNYLIMLLREAIIYVSPVIIYLPLKSSIIAVLYYLIILLINFYIRKISKQYPAYCIFYPIAGIIIILIMVKSYINIAILKKTIWKERIYYLRTN